MFKMVNSVSIEDIESNNLFTSKNVRLMALQHDRNNLNESMIHSSLMFCQRATLQKKHKTQHTLIVQKLLSCYTTQILGYPDLYVMKLVNSHVFTVAGAGDVIESEMMYNPKFSSVPYGPCSPFVFLKIYTYCLIKTYFVSL